MARAFRLAALAAAILPACAAAEGARDAGGFVSLFNGRDLTGWVYGRMGEAENRAGKGYQVENGFLYCTAEDGGNLYTEKEYSDFVFRFEFRLTANANNGIGIRAPLEGDSAYVGMEIQVLDDGGSEYQRLRSVQYHGSIYDVVAAKRGHQRAVGEWNLEEITARGRRIKVVLNGSTIVDANLEEVTDPKILERHPGLARKSGHIGFLGHGTRVEFRGMSIREIIPGTP